VENRAHEDSIKDIASSADSVGLKASRSPMLIEHRPSHLNYNVFLSFHNSILMRNTRGRELLINTVFKAKLIKRGIPELGPIITMNGFQEAGMLSIKPQG
jgi:hypothetical protein